MHVHEFLAKELLARRGIGIPLGRVAESREATERAAREMAVSRYVVKAQLRAGDRLAGGGIRFADTPAEASAAAQALIGQTLTTRQTGPRGEVVRQVYVEEAIESLTTLYVAVAIDRAAGELVALASGSMLEDEDDETWKRDKLRQCSISLAGAHADADFSGLAQQVAPDGANTGNLAELLQRLADTAIELDATLIEINPLALTHDGRLLALDAKMTIDDNAMFRHPDLIALRRTEAGVESDPTELMADNRSINYVAMDGNIGVVVNGAGLALATLDSLIEAGGRPANFMDIRTTATSLDIAFAFGLVLSNTAAQAVLVNVHGGGMQRCDTIAEGIGIAMRRSGRSLPLVVRLAGNNADFARERLKSFGINFVEGSSIADAAAQVTAIAAKEVA